MSATRAQPERTGKRAKYEDESATADKEEKARAPIFFDTSEQHKCKVQEIEELGAVRRQLAEEEMFSGEVVLPDGRVIGPSPSSMTFGVGYLGYSTGFYDEDTGFIATVSKGITMWALVEEAAPMAPAKGKLRASRRVAIWRSTGRW